MQPSRESGGLDLSDAHVSRAAKQAFFQIIARWNVSNEEARTLLGAPTKTTFFNWKKSEGGLLSRDVIERVSYVLGIYKALHILFQDSTQADQWIRKPNDAFAGQSALARMLAGNVSDLHQVRSYLDHVRGGLS
jgi:Protein of unknown function (DUF2384)